MSDHQGEMIDLPIQINLLEVLSLTELFISFYAQPIVLWILFYEHVQTCRVKRLAWNEIYIKLWQLEQHA